MTLVKRRENLFPSMWNDLFNDDFFRGHSLEKSAFTVPAVNIKENADSYSIELAVPGKKKEDFNIELDNDLLTISSETNSESTDENENYTKRNSVILHFQDRLPYPMQQTMKKFLPVTKMAS